MDEQRRFLQSRLSRRAEKDDCLISRCSNGGGKKGTVDLLTDGAWEACDASSRCSSLRLEYRPFERGGNDRRDGPPTISSGSVAKSPRAEERRTR